MVKTRGTWLVLPFYALFLTFYLRQLSVTRKIFILLLPLVLVGGAMLSSGMVKQRIYDVGSDIQAYSDGGNRETSVGQRLQIWQASWKLYVDHPWLGIGREGFKPELHEMARRGKYQMPLPTFLIRITGCFSTWHYGERVGLLPGC
jgi:O-antigen ligase